MESEKLQSLYERNIEGLSEVLENLGANKNVQSVLLFAADKNHPPKEILDPLLKAFPKPIIGGIFPEIIFRSNIEKEGFLIIPLNFKFQSALVDLGNMEEEGLYGKIADHFKSENGLKGTIMVFVDAFNQQKNNFIHDLYNFFGLTVNYLGGGAGSLSFQQFPCIFHNSGAHQDAAVAGIFQTDFSMGVAHGWSPISAPMKITEAKGNKIFSIDWQPAFGVYKTWVESHSGLKFNEHNFFDLAKSYPLGMVKLDSEMVIRDPYAVEDGVLHIVDQIPEGEYVSIMHGNMDSLLAGARVARESALKIPDSSNLNQQFCIDCISRALYMQEDFGSEMAILSQTGPVDGILSIGEIANTGESYLEVFNKTIVFAKWKLIT